MTFEPGRVSSPRAARHEGSGPAAVAADRARAYAADGGPVGCDEFFGAFCWRAGWLPRWPTPRADFLDRRQILLEGAGRSARLQRGAYQQKHHLVRRAVEINWYTAKVADARRTQAPPQLLRPRFQLHHWLVPLWRVGCLASACFSRGPSASPSGRQDGRGGGAVSFRRQQVGDLIDFASPARCA